MIQTILFFILSIGSFQPASLPKGGVPFFEAADPDTFLPGQTVVPDTTSASFLADRLIGEATLYLGRPYRYGAGGPKAFDCSGFSSFIFRKFGYHLSRSSKGQATDGRAVEGPLSNLQRGDLVIFGSRRNKSVIGHVGIVTEVNPSGTNFSFIHAARTGVIISQLQEEYYRDRFLGARRVLSDIGGRVAVTGSPDIGSFVRDTLKTASAAPATQPSVAEVHPDYFDGSTAVRTDTLLLGTGDVRVLLFGDGTWAYVAPDGTMIAPSSNDRIVLEGNGRWKRTDRTGKAVQTPVTESSSSSGSASRSAGSGSRVSGISDQPSVEEPPLDMQYHTIRKGDTLAGIANRYGTTVDRLCELNGITRRTVLRIGRRLRVR